MEQHKETIEALVKFMKLHDINAAKVTIDRKDTFDINITVYDSVTVEKIN